MAGRKLGTDNKSFLVLFYKKERLSFAFRRLFSNPK
jgi:hypothetical protein